MAAGDAAAEWTALADEVLLPDEFVQRSRAHPGGQRLALGWWLEQRLGPRASRASRAWHGSMVARRTGRTGPSDGQNGVAPVPCSKTHSPISSAISDPPMITRRRTSRLT